MIGFGIVIGVLIMVLGAVSAAYPRMWWNASKWQYRHPEAVEPSEEAFGVNQFAGAGLVLLGLFITVWFWSLAKTDDRQRAERERQEQVDDNPSGVVDQYATALIKEARKVGTPPRRINRTTMASSRTRSEI